MYNIFKELRVKSSVLGIEVFDNYTKVIDNLYNVYFIEHEKFTIEKDINIFPKTEPLHQFSKAVGISNGGYLAMIYKDRNQILILANKDTDVKKKVLISNHRREVETMAFSRDMKTFASGGADGKVYLFDTKVFKSFSSLERQSDTISKVSFSKDNTKIVATSFNKNGIVFDINRNKEIINFQTETVVEDSKFFDNDKKIAVVTRGGDLVVYDITKKPKDEEEEAALEDDESGKFYEISNDKHCKDDWPTTIDITADQKYAVVGSRKSNIALVRLEDNLELATLTLDKSGITNVRFFKDKLVVGFFNGTIEYINMETNLDQFKAALKSKDYTKIKVLIVSNKFLLIHPIMEEFYSHWKNVLKKAIDLLSMEKIDEAIDITSPFMDDPVKAEEFKKYLDQKEEVKKFSDLLKRKKYIRAYQLCEKNEELKSLNLYQELEEYWLTCFRSAKKLLEQNSSFNTAKANQLLEPFLKVRSKEALVRNLLDNVPKFAEADLLVKEQKFEEYFKMASKYKFLQETDLYKKVDGLLNKYYNQGVALIQEQKYQNALKVLNVLKPINKYREQIAELLVDIDYKIKLKRAVANKDIQLVYQLAHEHDTIRFELGYKEIEKVFLSRCEMAKAHAFAGKPKQVVKILDQYQNIEFTMDKVATLVKTAYIEEIKLKMKAGLQIDWGVTLANYAKFFGKDDEIRDFYETIHKESFIEAIAEPASGKEGFHHHDFEETVVEIVEAAG
jgi:WD40 repeat protein